MSGINITNLINSQIDALESSTTDIRLENGSVRTNMEWGLIPEDTREALANALQPLVEARDALMDALSGARAAGDDQLETTLQGELSQVTRALTDAKSAIESFNGLGGDGGIEAVIHQSGIGGKGLEGILQSITSFPTAGFHAAANDARTTLGGDGGASFMAAVAPPSVGIVGEGSVGGALNADAVLEMLGDPGALAGTFESDPKGFFAALKDMSSEDRQSIVMTLQNKLQADNQLFSMLSNFQKAMHDSEKAVIANLRV